MRVLICGVRGSSPAPGSEFVRYGGNTPCVAIAPGNDGPRLVLDGGTGLRRLSSHLNGAPFRGTILLGHLHWDHVQGLPFFPAGDRDDARIDLYMPEQGNALAVLERMMSPPLFPISPRELRGEWRFMGLEEGQHSFEGLSVVAAEVPHKGGRAFGYRVTDGAFSLAYVSDHSPISAGARNAGTDEHDAGALRLCEGADLLLHDGQYTAAEFAQRSSFGHSSVDYAVALAEEAGVRRLLLFHHDPCHTDDQIDEMVSSCASASVEVGAAAEGMTIDL
jgi:phosphoribosyl 1,2-cyclic phosphodiesterase